MDPNTLLFYGQGKDLARRAAVPRRRLLCNLGVATDVVLGAWNLNLGSRFRREQ
jgi:hypothetical protein